MNTNFLIIITHVLLTINIIIVFIGLDTKIDEQGSLQHELNNLKERLIISEALVKKCAENDTIDIMQYVRDVKKEIEVEFDIER